MSKDKTFLLSRFEFAQVRDTNTAIQSTIPGPERVQLTATQELIGVFRKIVLGERQWCIVENPFSEKLGDIQIGKTEQRFGSDIFHLHPGESVPDGVQNEIVLTDDEALIVRALKDCPHPVDETEGAVLKAGEETTIVGPKRLIPHKDLKIVERRESISLSANQGVHIQDDDTGKVRNALGPDDFFRRHNESLWDKPLTDDELQALGFTSQHIDEDTRALAASPRRRKSHEVVVVELEDNEAICLFDKNGQRVEFGPRTVFLEPHERPKVLHLSGGVPIRPSVLKVAKLSLGPDFIRDRLNVRTSDNAVLTLEIVFRWKFAVDADNPGRIFLLKDPIGSACQALSSRIREVAAGAGFEEFHSKAASIIKTSIFGGDETFVFEENGFTILGIDVESVTPADEEIAAKLTQTIKTTVDIVTERQQQEAKLESERRLIAGQAKNEEARKELVDLQIANDRKEKVEAARTAAEALKLRTVSEADAIIATAKAQAKADRECKKVEVDLKKQALKDAADVDKQRLQDKADAEIRSLEGRVAALGENGPNVFADIERARAFKATDKLVLPADSKLVAGLESVVTVGG